MRTGGRARFWERGKGRRAAPTGQLRHSSASAPHTNSARPFFAHYFCALLALAMRQIVPLASSDTRRAPSLATATPTGRPHTVESLTTNPVAKSSYSPVGTPSFMITRITLYPVRLLRFHEPCSAAKILPEYSGGNCCPV